MTDISVILVTAGSDEEASRIGRTLVEEKLVACVNIIPRIRSIYWWQGEVCDDEEVLLIMKSATSKYPLIQDRIRALHSYEVPEIITFPIVQGLPEYLKWVIHSTTQSS